MGEHLIKPYEISVWEDRLIQSGATYKFEERKLAVIGSDTMTGLNRVYDPVFNKKSNGEKTLTFSLKYKYFDPYSGNYDIINPFAALLVNERKVKLHYDGQWYEFIIKDHTESSDGLVWTYTCNDAFVLELSKNGYNITFDSELNNNQGTARELAEITLENTDWQVGNTDIFKQYIEEPVYKAVLNSKQNIEIINVSNNEQIPAKGANIYVFYSYVKNKDGKFVQFIIRDDNREYIIDDKNVITDTNFRIVTDLVYEERHYPTINDDIIKGFWLVDTNKNYTLIISLKEIENRYHVNRLAYGQLTTYDPVMERTVDRFTGPDNLEVYKYTDYKYTTSDLVVNYITNGNNFNALEDGTLQGWNPYTDQSNGNEVHKLELVTKPELATNKPLATLSKLSSVEGFLKVQFNGSIGSSGPIYNTLYNSGIENNALLINSISKGDKFIFRWRAATGTIDSLQPTNHLRLIVAKYTQDSPTLGYYYKHINRNDIILHIFGSPKPSYNYITGGTFEQNQDGTLSYVIDGVPQTPSTKYIYKSGNNEKVWNGLTYETKTNENYRPYYYLTGIAKQAISETTLKNSTEKIGIFIYDTYGAETCYIQDIQLTRYYEDADGNPLFIGNTPTATSLPINYYYIKPNKDTAAEDVHTYSSLEELAADINISVNSIKPLYNENSEKTLSISVSQSNCFNILQTIAETFECWVDLEVQHDSYGYIIHDDNNIPQKFVHLREYIGHDNWAGFKYGINLRDIERTVNSEEIVTKLIVNDSQSDLVDEGYISISNALSNQSGESYILNFDYYYNQGLLNREEAEQDKNELISQLATLNIQLREKEAERRNLENAFTTLTSNKNVYSDLITTAQDNKTRNLAEFNSLKKMTYEQYQAQHMSLEPAQRLTEDETLYNIFAELYTNSATINNYSGLLATTEKQWNEVNQKLNGIEGTEDIGIKAEIDQLIEEKKVLINNFENKYRKYILEGTWNSTDYIDSELYYLDAVQVSNTSAQPIVSYTINVVEISQLEGFEFYNFDAGDKTYIEDTEFFGWSNKNGILTPAREEVIVSEVEWHLDSPEDNSITVQNYKSRFEDLFQRVSAAVQTVQYNEATYAKISTLLDANGTINQDVLLTSLNNISGKNYSLTSDGSIIIDGDRILVRNLNNPANCVIINSEGIRISSDGGNTWRTAIDGQGINIGTVYTGTLNTNNVIIGNSDNPSFRWDKSGISAYKNNGTTTDSQGNIIDTYDLQTFVRYDQNGLYGIKNGESYNPYTLEDIKNKAHFAVTWDGFFIKNAYEGGGKVEITSDNDFRVLRLNNIEKIKIGALEWKMPGWQPGDPIYTDPTNLPDGVGGPSLYGIRIKNDAGDEVFKTTDEGNIEITGTINATGGNFSDIVTVGKKDELQPMPPYIIIDGNKSLIQSSNYQDGAGYGWMINKDGDAVFNNITARGAIKTAVFEYAEIQAVGGIFIFRPSSTIKAARISGDNLIVKVEKPLLFAKIVYTLTEDTTVQEGKIYYRKTNYGYEAVVSPTSNPHTADYYETNPELNNSWCKISNYTSDGSIPGADIRNILLTNGLSHVYRISNVNVATSEVTLKDGKAFVDAIKQEDESVQNVLDQLIGGALVDMGRKDGTTNYGIGVNSSDNTVNLPARAISLFETVIDETKSVKVSYRYRGILGTLPALQYTGLDAQVNPLYHDYLEGTQGIYTDNMYLGDKDQFLTFYTDNSDPLHPVKKLRIRANQLVFEAFDKETGEPTGEWIDANDIEAEGIPGPPGESAVTVNIESNIGNNFIFGNREAILSCYVYEGTDDITSTVQTFTWTKVDRDGDPVQGWVPKKQGIEDGLLKNQIMIDTEDVDMKSIFYCNVLFD